MADVIGMFWLFIGGIIVTILLGIVAGFSPTLYITQVGIGLRTKKIIPYMIAIMVGVVGALIALTILFQFFNLNTLLEYLDRSVSVLLVSVIFNMLVGAALIIGGAYYLRHREPKTKQSSTKATKSSYAALVGFGFLRKLISVTGVAVTFIASNVIAEASTKLSTQLLLTAIFLISATLPYIGIAQLVKTNPERLEKIVNYTKQLFNKLNYRSVIGVGAILFGAGIVIFNICMIIFY